MVGGPTPVLSRSRQGYNKIERNKDIEKDRDRERVKERVRETARESQRESERVRKSSVEIENQSEKKI